MNRLGVGVSATMAVVAWAWAAQPAAAECYYSHDKYVCPQQGRPALSGNIYDDRAMRQLQQSDPNLRGYTGPSGFGSPSQNNLNDLRDLADHLSSGRQGVSR